MTRCLLDANLSPKVAKHLARELRLDVFSMQGRGLGQLGDRDTIQLARSSGVMMIALDCDFVELFSGAPARDVGVISLNVPSHLRRTREIYRLLAELFRDHAEGIDLDKSLVVISERVVQVTRR